jgi:beta-glucosidase
MTLEEKIGQMVQIDRSVATVNIMRDYFIGSVLSGGGSAPLPEASAQNWVDMINEYQKGALVSRLGIPMIYGIDAVHGHNNVYNATIFPHNVGLGATRQVLAKTFIRSCMFPISVSVNAVYISSDDRFEFHRDPDLVKRIGAATAVEVRATGIPYTFAPCIAVCRDPRWGRCYESYSEDHKVVEDMTDVILGLQGEPPSNYKHGVPFVGGRDKVAACAKHYVGDGGTTRGVNENNTVTDLHGLLSVHMPAYADAVYKGVSTVMVSYSSWNGEKMHANTELITGYLKGTLKFKGFVISDWQGVDKISTPPHTHYTASVRAAIQAGIDMVMVPFNFTEFVNDLTTLVKNNSIPVTRIDDAVRRILLVKFTMGLFENPLADYSFSSELGSQAHRDLAREAVRKSLVLLKNGNKTNPMLPLPRKTSKILVAGTHADNLGYQCGGWTITWQGFSGNKNTRGTTLLSAVKSAVDQSTEVVFRENPDAEFIKSNNFAYAIIAVGEPPYAETAGDSDKLTMLDPGPAIISSTCQAVKCVVVVISGRPLVMEPYVASIDALVAAWLPGTEGQGITDALFGDHGFSGKLPVTWFRNTEQLPMSYGDTHYDPLFAYGSGLETESVASIVARSTSASATNTKPCLYTVLVSATLCLFIFPRYHHQFQLPF